MSKNTIETIKQEQKYKMLIRNLRNKFSELDKSNSNAD